MTICVSVSVAEGLVFAADSTSTLIGQMNMPGGKIAQGVLQTFEFANKVSQFKDYPIAIMSWGLGSIGDRSIQSLVMEFEYDYKSCTQNKGYKVQQIASDLVTFMKNRYDAAFPVPAAPQPAAPQPAAPQPAAPQPAAPQPAAPQPAAPQPAAPPRPQLGLVIGGFSSKAFFAEQYAYDFPTSTLTTIRPKQPNGSPDFGINWFGQADALVRLILGFDEGALNELAKRGVDPNTLNQLYKTEFFAQIRLVFDGMPLQDAIDLASYATMVVIGRYRFAAGVPSCGGPVDIAVITPNSFQWAKRKQWAIK